MKSVIHVVTLIKVQVAQPPVATRDEINNARIELWGSNMLSKDVSTTLVLKYLNEILASYLQYITSS